MSNPTNVMVPELIQDMIRQLKDPRNNPNHRETVAGRLAIVGEACSKAVKSYRDEQDREVESHARRSRIRAERSL